MPNYNKSFNFRNGVQVDNDNFIVNTNGLVGIGTTVPTELLDVRGNIKVVGVITATEIISPNLSATGVSSAKVFNSGITSITSGIISASSGVVTYYGDGSKLSNLPTSQWIDVDVGLGFTSIYAAGNVGVATTNPQYSFQVGPDPSSYSAGIGINSNGNVLSKGTIEAAYFSGIGSQITQINASNISSGTLSTSRFPSDITLSGIITAASFVGSGAGITEINASNISSGTLSNSRLPSTISATSFVGTLTGTATTALTIDPGGTLISGISSVGIATVSNTLYVVGAPAKIGVGTQTVEADIEVYKSGISSIRVSSRNSIATIGIGRSAEIRTGNTSVIYPYSTRNSLDIINSNGENVNFYLDYGSAGLGTGSFNWIYGQNASYPLMSLTYGGNLGLGVTDPTSKLYVSGSTYLGGITTVGSNLIVTNNLTAENITFTGSITGNLGITTLPRLGIATNTVLSNSYEFFVGGDPVYGDGVSITSTDIRASGSIQSSNLTSTNANITNINSTGIITSSSFISSTDSNPVQIIVSGNTLTFTVDGIGSTSLTLS